MASAEIGALRVRLGMDAGEFKKGSKEAESVLDRLGNRFNINAASMARAGAAMGAAVVAATAVIGHSVLSMLKEMDKLGKMAQSMGIPVETLSRLKLAADLSDVSVEKLATSVGRLSRNMMEAASGGTSEAARSFQALGITVTTSSGQLKSAEQVILEVAAKFQNMEDGAGKTALAMALFGRAGAELIPMLNAGATGIRGMMREADQFGIVVSAQAAKAAEEFNDTLTRLRAAKDGLVQQVTIRVLPALQMIASRFLEAAKDGDTMKAIAEGIVRVFVVVAQSVAAVAFVFQRLGAELIAVKDAIAALFSGDFTRARQIMTDAATATDQAREALNRFSTELQNMTSGWQAVVTPAEEFPNRVAAPIVQSTRAMTDALRALRDERRAAFEELVNSETETFANKMRAAEKAVRDKTITMTQYGAVVRRINKENERHMDSMATATATALTTIFRDNKAAAIGAAVINTAAGITRNLREYPQPYAGIMAGITAATGAAQIAAIRSTNQSGGGSVPSVSSAASTAPVQQEFVQTLHVQGINPSQMFRGDVVKDFAQELIEYQRNGGRVVLQ